MIVLIVEIFRLRFKGQFKSKCKFFGSINKQE